VRAFLQVGHFAETFAGAQHVQQLRQFIFYTVRHGRIEKVECAIMPA
jgi:hypothetical protein